MPPSPVRDKLAPSRLQGSRFRAHQRALVPWILALNLIAVGCSAKDDNTNSTPSSASNTNASASSDSSAARSHASLNVKEPDRYSVSVTIGAQEAGDDPAKMPTLQFNLTRLDADRRWEFALPAPLGRVVYLEKSGLRYLILTERRQYTEVSPNEIGFPIGELFTPRVIADHLRGRAQFDNIGVEPVNGRTATKHRFSGTDKERDSIEGLIFVDMETGLPVRSEVNVIITGSKFRMMVESRDLQLNPDRAQFDVPEGMKKVTPDQANQQIQRVVSTLRFFADKIFAGFERRS